VSDGASGPPQFYLPTSAQPGDWQLTPACPPAGGVLLHWQNVTPFGVRSSRQFRAPRPPPLVSSRYTQDFEEVMTVGAINSTGRPQDRADVAILYAVHLAGPVWNQVVRQVSAAQGTGLSANARAFALLNMAIADGLITVMETKYHYNFWRPETAIREAASDGNRATSPDPTFAPFVITPCHPSYPSAHATASYAARTIIEPIWGSDNHSIVMETPALPQIVLSYSRLDQITTDIDDVRVYGGIHFRFDQVAGARQGIRIGEHIFRHHLRSRRGP
jgi:membrane-associated phospholipid phosphatase